LVSHAKYEVFTVMKIQVEVSGCYRRVVLCNTNVLGSHAVSVFRVKWLALKMVLRNVGASHNITGRHSPWDLDLNWLLTWREKHKVSVWEWGVNIWTLEGGSYR